jgi:tetratricopeptide (TPR) repeat protein
MTKRKPKARLTSQKNKKKAGSGKTYKKAPSFLTVLRKNWIQTLVLAALSISMYFLSFGYDYILDDQIVITKNQYTKEGVSGIWKLLSTETFQGYFGEQKDLVAGARYRPLSLVTFAIEHEISPLNPHLSHIINALLFALTVLILYEILLLLFEWKRKKKPQWFLSIALWASLIFVLHPIHTEAVANIKGRDEIMALLFSLAAFRAYISYSINGRIGTLAIASVLFFLGLLSKENSITFCAVIPMGIYLFGYADIKTRTLRNTLISVTLMAFAFLSVRMGVIGYFLDSGKEITELMNNPFLEMNTSEKFATIFHTLLLYIRLLFWPDPLCHDYYPYAIAIKQWTDWTVWLSVLVHLGILGYGLLGLKKRHKGAFIALYYLVTLSIVSNFVFPVGTFMNERFLFMPSVAFAIFLPWLLIEVLLPKFGHKYMVKWSFLGLMGIYCIILGFLTLKRLPDWSDPVKLNRSAVEAYPNSARSNCFMGTALFNVARETPATDEKLKIFSESEAYLRKSIEIYPEYYNSLKMLSGIAAERFTIDRDIEKLLAEFERIGEIKPSIDYLHQYCEYLNKTGSYKQSLLNFYYRLGYERLAKKQGNYAWGLKYLDYGLKLDPENRRFAGLMIELLDKTGKNNQANFLRQKYGL